MSFIGLVFDPPWARNITWLAGVPSARGRRARNRYVLKYWWTDTRVSMIGAVGIPPMPWLMRPV